MSEGALAAVREACNELTPLPDYLHDALLRYFRSYVVVGGMPEVVQRFYDGGGDFATVYELQVELVKSYKNDISKYAGKRALDVQAIFDQLPLQLDSDSRRFVLNSIDDDARYERYRQDFVWLVNAGVGLKTDLVREPKSPLAATARAGHPALVRELLPAAVHAAEGHPAGGRPAEDLGLPLRMRLPVKGRRGSWTGLRLS